jgi:hypothetical protein
MIMVSWMSAATQILVSKDCFSFLAKLVLLPELSGLNDILYESYRSLKIRERKGEISLVISI